VLNERTGLLIRLLEPGSEIEMDDGTKTEQQHLRILVLPGSPRRRYRGRLCLP